MGLQVVHGELDVGISFVVTQEDIEAWLALLDEVVLEREGLAFVGDDDIVDVHGFAHE